MEPPLEASGVEAGQWLNDTFCYEAAFHALRDALVMAAPEYEGKRPDIFSWAARTAAAAAISNTRKEMTNEGQHHTPQCPGHS